MKQITNNTEAMELVATIIEVFEDFLDEKGIVINNPDKADAPDASNIYGMDFGYMMYPILDILKKAGTISEEVEL